MASPMYGTGVMTRNLHRGSIADFKWWPVRRLVRRRRVAVGVFILRRKQKMQRADNKPRQSRHHQRARDHGLSSPTRLAGGEARRLTTACAQCRGITSPASASLPAARGGGIGRAWRALRLRHRCGLSSPLKLGMPIGALLGDRHVIISRLFCYS